MDVSRATYRTVVRSSESRLLSEELLVKMPARHAEPHPVRSIRLTIVALVALLLAFGGMSPHTLAAPGAGTSTPMIRAQNVDWMSAEMAARLDLPMDVLVPAWVPAPFDGSPPSVTASGGYYQIYWMVPGGSPTFLYIEGTAGGSMPAGSPADLNKPLSVNASVQGWNAIHDIGIPAGSDTPIYDQVWWVANGVLYTVSSNNMTGSDSLSLANSLVVLQGPTADPPVAEAPVVEAPAGPSAPEAPAAPETSSGNNGGGSSAPSSGLSASEADSAPAAESTSGSTESPTGEGASEGERSPERESSGAGERVRDAWSPDRYDGTAPSDGTSGPLPPIIGTDGTGGLFDTALPSILFTP